MDQPSSTGFAGRVGERWVLRVRLPDGSASDVTGWVERVGARAVVLRTRAGDLTEVTLEPRRLVAARRVTVAYGGPDPRRTSAEELERVAALAWVGDWETLGSWTLRAAGGFTGRANSCLAVGDPGMEIEAALSHVTAYAHRHGIRPMVQVVEDSDEQAAIRGAGWTETYVRTTVLTTRLSSWLGADPPNPRATVSETWTPAWEEAYHRSRPSHADPELVRRILASSPPRAFAAVAGEDERPAAIGRGQLTGGWVGLASIWTDPDSRRRGLATAVMVALGHWAARRGARSAYLQVASANEAAVRAYERLGFAEHHRYLYLARPEWGRGR